MKKKNAAISAPAAKTKKPATPASWKKGQSGNPKGRPKLPEDQLEARRQAQAILDAHTPEAAWGLILQMRSKNPLLAARAREQLLDRGGFVGTQRIELTGKDGKPIESNNNHQVLHVVDPVRAVRILNVLASAGSLPVGVAVADADDDAEIDEVREADANGKADSLPPG